MFVDTSRSEPATSFFGIISSLDFCMERMRLKGFQVHQVIFNSLITSKSPNHAYRHCTDLKLSSTSTNFDFSKVAENSLLSDVYTASKESEFIQVECQIEISAFLRSNHTYKWVVLFDKTHSFNPNSLYARKICTLRGPNHLLLDALDLAVQ